jgi:hypothetical protein
MPHSNNYYDDSEQAPEAPDDGSGSQPEDKGEEYPTAMLPKAMFGGEVKPGDTISLKVEKVDEDNVICCKDEGTGKDEKEEVEPEESPAAPGGMSSMMED